jgi:transposase
MTEEVTMPTKRLTMRKIREVLRLRFDCNLPFTQIATSCDIGRSTVFDYLQRFEAAELGWPLPANIDDGELERRLFPLSCPDSTPKRDYPDFEYLHRELRRKSVTLMLLWQEYKELHPDGYQYSQFCHLYRQWTKHIDPVMRQQHLAGEKMFVDYAGQSVNVFDLLTGQIHQAQIFIAVLGASNYTYAQATWTQQLPDWIDAHCRAFAYFGGVAELTVPDNLKTGVTKACFYEPDINPTYLDMARHYGTIIIPTRVRKPKDKAKVEVAVQIVERWILARLRNQTFFGLQQLNEAIRPILEQLNQKPFQKLPGSRKSLFDTIDKSALKPLPVKPYQFAEWKTARVNIDYHIEVDRHYYSVPHQFIKKQIDVRITTNTVECFYKNNRVASHIRSNQPGHHSTIKQHMPKSHQKWVEWTPQRFVRWAEKIGPMTTALIKKVLTSRRHPQQGFRSALGILRLVKSYGENRLEAACKRALLIDSSSYRSVASILKHSLDQRPVNESEKEPSTITHTNIRGAHYYH